ncbi:MAG: flagellar export chaperone FlgN [Planctomycetota bacterium]
MTKPASPSQSPQEAEQVLYLLERQRGLYLQLKALADQQGQLIASGETEQLLSLLARRQGLIDMLGQCSAEIAPYRARIGEIAEQAGGKLNGQIKSLVQEVRTLLESIMEQDDEGRRSLSESRDAVGQQLQQAAGAGAAISAYGPKPGVQAAARYTDRRA